MKVILLQDVAKIGRKLEIVAVPDGYALNFLIPKKMAKAATSENVKNLSALQSHVDKQRGESMAEFMAAKEILEGKSVDITAPQNEQGHLFAAIKNEAIISALKDKGAILEASMLKVNEPIKSAGSHEVSFVCCEEKFKVVLNIIPK